MNKDIKKEDVMRYLQEHPELTRGSQKQLAVRMYPHEIERLTKLKGSNSYREFINKMMDIYEEKAGG